jgi:hypothetical protein
MAPFSKQPLTGADVRKFLRMFEGAAATFAEQGGHWSLWLPEFHADEHPLTPASQVFFPVILRHDEQAFAIRFFYDCSTGKVRYYTSAIPEEVARLPEFENAVSELFRHTLPVEPIRQRSLGKNPRPAAAAPLKPRRASVASLAEPAESAPRPAAPAVIPPPAPARAPIGREIALTPPPVARPLVPAAPAVEEATPAPPAAGARHHVRLEIGPRARHVLLAGILALTFLALVALGIYAYLQATADPGVEHHKLQIEEMRLHEGR